MNSDETIKESLCRHCGSQAAKTFKFCPECGSPLQSAEPITEQAQRPEAPAAQPQPASRPTEPPKTTGMSVVLAGFALMLTLFALRALWNLPMPILKEALLERLQAASWILIGLGGLSCLVGAYYLRLKIPLRTLKASLTFGLPACVVLIAANALYRRMYEGERGPKVAISEAPAPKMVKAKTAPEPAASKTSAQPQKGPSAAKPKAQAPARSTNRGLNASVVLGDAEIHITNRNDFAWNNVAMYLNGVHVFGSNFVYQCATLGAGETFTVAAKDFTLDDGTRFNPFSTKIRSLFVACATPKGTASGTWRSGESR